MIIEVLKADLYRYAGNSTLRSFLKYIILGKGYQYIFWLRITQYFYAKKGLYLIGFVVSRIILKYFEYKLGITISHRTQIGKGLFIAHFGQIIVHPDCVIGANCNLSQGVTLGKTNRGNKKGVPMLGDNVYVGPGAKIIGGIHIGNNAAVGANAVVTSTADEYSVLVGIPARVLSKKGSVGYINNIDY